MTTSSTEETQDVRRSIRVKDQIAKAAASRIAGSSGRLQCTSFICVEMCAEHFWVQRTAGSVCEQCGKSSEVCFQVPKALEPNADAALELQGDELYKALVEILRQADDVFVMQMKRHL